VAAASPPTRRYIHAGIAGFHVEDEINPKHSKHVNGLCSIEDMQWRIEAAVRARRDVGSDLVIIARCDEMYPSERGGGGTGDSDEAIRRGNAYAEAGADALVFPPLPDPIPMLAKEMKTPVCTLGFNIPGTAFTLSTGWGWVTAATNHLKIAKELMETGTVSSANYNFPEKYDLIEHPLYDGLIEEWAQKTGRKTRANHAR
jgi:2-methylisocitrate lyase-like PEP mutase family enzyme